MEVAGDTAAVQPSSSAGDDNLLFKRKKHHRRAKKRKNRKGDLMGGPESETTKLSEDAVPSVEASSAQSPSDKSSTSLGTIRKDYRKRCRKHYRRPNRTAVNCGGAVGKRLPSFKGKKSVFVLRPTIGPLVNAPKNSTQYIIEDHVEGGDCDAESYDSDPSDGGKGLMSKSWIYFEKDFQTVYESAHREEVEEWDRPQLIKEISNLEKRQKELVSLLSRLDPEVYLRRLQSRAAAMLERNRVLKTQLKLNKTSSSPKNIPAPTGGNGND